jgi:hypothetical protein
MGGDNSCLSGG